MRPDPIVLAFDTSAAHCAAALLTGDRIAVTHVEDMTRGQAERLMPLLEDVLTEAGIGWQDLTALGVGIGPGNFTGIRISVSAARGLALGLGIPAVGISLFDTTCHLTGVTQVAVPAPRDMAYVMDFGADAPPSLSPALPGGFTLSTVRDAAAHVQAMARLAAARAAPDTPRPAPLYLKPADAAPSRDSGPVMLP